MTSPLLQPTRVYQNHHLDSTRWDEIEPRAGDIIVTTSYKSGTTWTQQILNALLHDGEDPLPSLSEVSPWVDARFQGPREQMAELCAGMQGRRFLKSHLPLDGLPFWEEAHYVVVCRDARDVFMSLLNHYRSYTELAFSIFNETPDRVGEPMPPCPDDARALWRDWMTRGWFEWENEGYPFWSNLRHTATYWPHRHRQNVLFLHYNDMLADLEGAVRRLSGFCRIDADDDLVARVVQKTTFSNLKKSAVEAEEKDGGGMPAFFHGGSKSFFNKGTNGRWRDLLTEDDLALYEEARQRTLEPDCARWLETGGALP